MGVIRRETRTDDCVTCGRTFTYDYRGGRERLTCSAYCKGKRDDWTRGMRRNGGHDYADEIRRPNVSEVDGGYEPMSLAELEEIDNASKAAAVARGLHNRPRRNYEGEIPWEEFISVVMDDHREREDPANPAIPVAKRKAVKVNLRRLDVRAAEYIGRTALVDPGPVLGSMEPYPGDRVQFRRWQDPAHPGTQRSLPALRPFVWDTVKDAPPFQRRAGAALETDWAGLPEWVGESDWVDHLCVEIDLERARKATGSEDPDVLLRYLGSEYQVR